MKRFYLLLSSLLLTLPSIAQQEKGIDQKIDEAFGPITNFIAEVVFVSFKFNIAGETVTIPFIILWLLLGALFFTAYFNFINFRLLPLAINIVRGCFKDGESNTEEPTSKLEEVINPKREEEGEVSHFQALTAALSGTVGLGNIAGVAVAIATGGPGATFWMIVVGLFGMSSKFVECTLGVKYRKIDEHGTVHGGPMYYLSQGLKSKNLGIIGKPLSIIFAFFCVLGSFGGGNMFQSNQAFQQLSSLPALKDSSFAENGWVFGLCMAVLVAIVIIGGIKSIAKVTDKIVPFMCGIYVFASLIILGMHFMDIPKVFSLIIDGAFNAKAAFGGFIGVMITGIKRAAFSNEAGVGSASIAHSAVKTKHAASEGIVALLEPLIDTVIVCTMTALVLIITGYYADNSGLAGIELTSTAFDSVLPGAKYIILLAVILFAFSTMISWSYYGLQAWIYIAVEIKEFFYWLNHNSPINTKVFIQLFEQTKYVEYSYKFIFCCFVVIGASATMDNVVTFSDCMILAMSFPNIIGLMILLPEVKQELNKYIGAIKDGTIQRIK